MVSVPQTDLGPRIDSAIANAEISAIEEAGASEKRLLAVPVNGEGIGLLALERRTARRRVEPL